MLVHCHGWEKCCENLIAVKQFANYQFSNYVSYTWPGIRTFGHLVPQTEPSTWSSLQDCCVKASLDKIWKCLLLVLSSYNCTIVVNEKKPDFATHLSHQRPSVDDHTVLLQESDRLLNQEFQHRQQGIVANLLYTRVTVHVGMCFELAWCSWCIRWLTSNKYNSFLFFFNRMQAY